MSSKKSHFLTNKLTKHSIHFSLKHTKNLAILFKLDDPQVAQITPGLILAIGDFEKLL